MASFEVVFVEDNFRHTIRRPVQILGIVRPVAILGTLGSVQWVDYDSRHLSWSECDGDDDAGTNVGAAPLLSAAVEPEAYSELIMLHGVDL